MKQIDGHPANPILARLVTDAASNKRWKGRLVRPFGV